MKQLISDKTALVAAHREMTIASCDTTFDCESYGICHKN